MSGSSSQVVYLGDDGTAYCTRITDWQKNIANAAATVGQGSVSACTTEPSLPKGLRRRKRYAIITATSKEKSFVVLDPASSVYTAPVGTAMEVPLFGAVVSANNATLRGRTGERTKAL